MWANCYLPRPSPMNLRALREASPALSLLLGHAALAVALFATNGGESLLGVFCVFGTLAWWTQALVGLSRRRAPAVGDAVGVAWLVAVVSVIVSIGLSFIRPPGLYLRSSMAPFLVLDGVAGVLLWTYRRDLSGAPLSPRLRVARRAALFALALAVGAWMLRASPNPDIDVFPINQQAAQLILAGKPLYAPGAVGVLDTWHHRDFLDSYLYLPFGACCDALAYALSGDVRWAQLVAQLLGGALLWIIARRVGPRDGAPRREAWADLLAAIFLFHPRGPFVLEEAWAEPLGVPLLGGFVLFMLQKRPFAASVCIGFLCATKQQLLFYVPFLALVPGFGFAPLVVAGVVTLAVMAPFVLRSVPDFYRATVSNLVHYPVRTDALNVTSELARVGILMPSWVGFCGWFVPVAYLPRIPRELTPLLVASCVAFTLFFLFGRQAFCNYYYLLDATALYALATLRDGEESAPVAR
jgi:hypothetical protein